VRVCCLARVIGLVLPCCWIVPPLMYGHWYQICAGAGEAITAKIIASPSAPIIWGRNMRVLLNTCDLIEKVAAVGKKRNEREVDDAAE
jgi:hypothetical protein